MLKQNNKRRKKTERQFTYFFPIDKYKIKILQIYFQTFACNLVIIYIL